MERYTLIVMRKVIIDLIILLILFAAVMWSRKTSPYERGFFCGDQSIMYPYGNNTISSNTLHLVGILLPGFVIIAVEIFTLSKKKEESPMWLGVRLPAWVRGCYGVLAVFAMGLLCCEAATNISKITIGRLRPCFMDVCKPSIDCSLPQNQGRYILPQEFHCTASPTLIHHRDLRMSFMSGHSSWAAYTMIFLALYLRKRLTWKGAEMLRYALQFTAVMLGFFTALSRISDYRHHPEDVLVGFLTGSLFAVIAAQCVSWIEHRDGTKLEAAPSTNITNLTHVNHGV